LAALLITNAYARGRGLRVGGDGPTDWSYVVDLVAGRPAIAWATLLSKSHGD
jgi:hypothetical protein